MLDDGLAQPRIALVLGSGGVRSIAALGIAEVLAGEGIRPAGAGSSTAWRRIPFRWPWRPTPPSC